MLLELVSSSSEQLK